MAPRDLALEAARQHGAPYLPSSMWAALVAEASAVIRALPDDATADDAAGAVMAYAAKPRGWEPGHHLRQRMCEGLAARIRRASREAARA
jgi:hypothetical protein